jgi:Glycosyltransferase family 87
MREDSTPADGSLLLARGPAGVAAAQADAVLPRLGVLPRALALPRLRVASGSRAGRLALVTMLACAFAVVVFSTARSSPLVPASDLGFPSWEAGPLHSVFGHVSASYDAISLGFSAVLLAMTAAYAIALLAVRTLSLRAIAITVVALHVILLLGPPLQLTDLFNYLGYARLGATHHVNPYLHGIGTALHDPVYRFTSWHHLRSPYGPLFTAFSYPVALLPIPVAYWVLKVVPVLMSLVFIALVYRCARLLGRDPRFAVMFVAANPVYIMYAVGGFHNDFFMLVPSTAAIWLLLARRDRSAGAMLMVAVGVKFTAVLLLPFLLLAARPSRRRLQLGLGAALAAIPLVALSLSLFGPHLPNLREQSTLLTDFSVPNLVGLMIGAGGAAPWLLRIANVAVVLSVALLLRRRVDWLAGAGWATFALLVSLAWLVPWYVIWLLPLAALATSVRMRRAAIAFTVFLVLTFMPATPMFMRARGINLMSSAVGQASQSLQHKLSQ